MGLNFKLQIFLGLLAILVYNGIIYSLIILKIIKHNSNCLKKFSIITNRSEKEVLPLILLIASNPLKLTSSESSTSQTLSVISSESSASQTLSVTSSDTNVSQEIFDILDSTDLIDSGITEAVTSPTSNSILSNINERIILSHYEVFEHNSAYDSITILNNQELLELKEIALAFHDFSVGTPANILQIFKFEELKILYSQDMIHFGISHTELRLIIDMIPSYQLFSPDINHFILTIMSYYHL
jgi:hypothetical protein